MGNFSAGNSSWDFTRPNPVFWQHFESRVQDVVALGIVPEIILFHPYDNGHWGFNAINTVCGKVQTVTSPHSEHLAPRVTPLALCRQCRRPVPQHGLDCAARCSALIGAWWGGALTNLGLQPGTPSALHCGNVTDDCLWCDENYIKYMVARVSAYGTATSTPGFAISPGFLSSTPPHTPRVTSSTVSPCLFDADWCLQSDVVTNSRRGST